MAVNRSREAAARFRRSPRRGVTLVEVVASALLVAFVFVSAMTLYLTWQRQVLISRNYSQAQTDLRTAFRPMLRTIRHSGGPIGTSVAGNLNGQSSSTSQIVVNVPQQTGGAVDIRFYQSGGTLYYQKQADTVGTAIISGVTVFTIHYYKTTVSSGVSNSGAVTASADLAPATATEAQLSLTVRSGSTANTTNDAAVTTVQSYVTLRNTSWMHL